MTIDSGSKPENAEMDLCREVDGLHRDGQGVFEMVTKTSKTPTKRRTAAKAGPPTGDTAKMTKELDALRKRARRIAKDLDSTVAARAEGAAAEWEQFHVDLKAWARKHGIAFETQTVKRAAPRRARQGAASTAGGSTHGCASSYGGDAGNGMRFSCIFHRYRRLSGQCLYSCFTHRPDMGTIYNPF